MTLQLRLLLTLLLVVLASAMEKDYEWQLTSWWDAKKSDHGHLLKK